jgi:HD-GYP domain-containing protein (c-di-GMP phosphodiesterase class II)
VTDLTLFSADKNLIDENQAVPFDVYIKAGNHTFRIIQENEIPFKPFVDKIKSKNIEDVFIHEKDLLKYIKFSLMRIAGENDKKVIAKDTELKAQRILSTFRSIYHCLDKQGVSRANLDLLKDLAIEVVRSLKLEKNNVKFIETLMKDQSSLKFSLARTAYSILICEQLEWKSEQTLSKISIASLLCDVGLYDRLDLGSKPVDLMSDDEKNVFSMHTRKSADLLGAVNFISTESIQAILHHHEYCDGSGFLNLKQHAIYPLAQIIRVADDFVNLVFSSPFNVKPLTVIKGIDELRGNKRYNQQFVNALSKVLIKVNSVK